MIPVTGTGGGGGVTDHGALTGLSDDDHLQYHNDTRGDVRYYLKAAVDALLAAKAALSHTHAMSEVTGLVAALAAIPSPISGVATVTVPANSGMGATSHRETVSIPGVTSVMKIVASLGNHDDADDNSEELLDLTTLSAIPGSGSITFNLSFVGREQGAIKINYMAL